VGDEAAGDPRGRRLRLLRRQASGVAKKRSVMALLESVGLHDTVFLSLQESDGLQEGLSATVGQLRAAGLLRVGADLDGDGLVRAVNRELDFIDSRSGLILVLSNADLVGMVELRSTIDGSAARDLLDSDRDSLTIVEPGFDKGLVLQRFEQPNGTQYQVESWSPHGAD
jgi:hypothetical protein